MNSLPCLIISKVTSNTTLTSLSLCSLHSALYTRLLFGYIRKPVTTVIFVGNTTMNNNMLKISFGTVSVCLRCTRFFALLCTTRRSQVSREVRVKKKLSGVQCVSLWLLLPPSPVLSVC